MKDAAVVVAILVASSGPKLDFRPLRKITNLEVGHCSVDVTFKLRIEDRGVEDYYCPRVEWEWEDGTKSTEEADCPPFDQASADEHRRVWTRVRAFKTSDSHRVKVRLYKADRMVHILEATAEVKGWEGMSREERRRFCDEP
jgi:hypothetical protein